MLLDKRRVSGFTKTFAVILAFAFISTMVYSVLGTRGGTTSSIPSDLTGLIKAGNDYSDDGQPQQAVDMYERALKIDPNNVDVRTDLAIAYYSIGNTQRAIDEALKGIKSNPKHSKVHYNLGIFYIKANKLDEAKKAWETFLTLEPTGQQADYVRQNLPQIGKPAGGG